jgi:hypothetical protein
VQKEFNLLVSIVENCLDLLNSPFNFHNIKGAGIWRIHVKNHQVLQMNLTLMFDQVGSIAT